MSAWDIVAAVAAVFGIFAVAFNLGFSAGSRSASTFLGRLHAAAARRTGETAAFRGRVGDVARAAAVLATFDALARQVREAAGVGRRS